ncbi:glycoside hydrolase [Acidobacteria bacterium AH-259-G07]|nr:glycoside hydrolase [Acidobacteria bacterium AH-259-G07]
MVDLIISHDKIIDQLGEGGTRSSTHVPGIVTLVFLATWISHFQAAAEVISVTEPFVSPKGSYVTQKDRYHTFRIPGMIVAQDGSVLAFAEGRRGDGSDPRRDENAPIDLVMRRSTDNGRTWQPMVVIDSGFRPNGDLVDFGDPTPVLDAETKTVFLFYGQWPDLGPRTVKHGQSADPDDGNQVVWVRCSTDNGKTWSDRKQVVYPDEPHETSDGLYWRQAEPGPGNGIQLQWQDEEASRNGRLIIPAKRSGSSTLEGPATVEPFVFYSDDHGNTWQVGNVTPGPDANEDEAVELTDGRVLLDARQNDGNFRRRHISTDGGVTWGPDNPDDIPITQVDGSMVRYSAKRARHEKDRILFSGARGENGLNRNNITVWSSYDEGKTFINPVQSNSGFAAYSVLQRLADGTIGLLVETAKGAAPSYGEITFYRFDIAELEPKGRSR